MGEGLSQGGHTTAPVIRRAADLAAAVTQTAGGVQRIVASPHGDLSLANLLGDISAESRAGSIHLCIGPERGFTAGEEALLAESDFRPVALGSSILRTETATILLSGSVCATLETRRGESTSTRARAGTAE